MNYKEEDFEAHIERNLLASGYVSNLPHDYDKGLCLIPTEVIAFIKDTQQKQYDKLTLQYGAETDAKLCQRLASEVEKLGVLHVLRKGFKDRGAKFQLAYFKPASGMNPEHLQLYGKNRFSVVRQLIYSKKNSKELDLAVFVNGLPIITAELKNSLTGQFAEDAKKQYMNDRDPKEPLFRFKRCLVHFAVGNEKAYMTTRLAGHGTRFLPFNLDTENPVNPNGHQTAYLWEDIWQKETLLNLLANYLHLQTSKEMVFDQAKGGLTEKRSESFIFPRFHQLDVVRQLLAATKTDGVGNSYLVQHSAGSGKSNSIAWLAHQLASLYRTDGDKDRMYDSIVVVTDRRVLDKQLQDTIRQFEQTPGVVQAIDKNSQQLKEALEVGKAIIITTLQKFPIISESIASLKGKKFAVIIDEAHTSQSGESSKHIKKALAAASLEDAENEEAEDENSDAFDLESKVVEEIRTRGKQDNITYYAFTATPKNKTLELFGKPTPDGQYVAFHVYSMRQAIEEGFIMDVLAHYTTFDRYFKLAKAVESDEQYEKKKAFSLLTKAVDLKPHAIETKVRIMLDHFRSVTEKSIGGKGRSMVVTRSRLHAVKFYKMFVKVMGEMRLPYKPIVAFSGAVHDFDTGEDHTESMNNLPPKTSIVNAFKLPEYRILIVANKFQTGFDEPLLHTMYVDKKLGGVNAVQTLSRLNRTAKSKSDTVVLDFVNDLQDIQTAFQDYYQTTFLDEATDPNKLYDLQGELEQFEIYTEADVQGFAKIFFDPSMQDELLQPILDRVRGIWGYTTDSDREDFRSILRSFCRLYGFMSQLLTFQDTDLEKLYVFGTCLLKKLPRDRQALPLEVCESVELDSFRIQQTYEGSIDLKKDNAEVTGMKTGKSKLTEDELDFLSAIIQTLNDAFGIELTEEDKLDMAERLRPRIEQDEGLQEAMNPKNSKDNVKLKFDHVFDEALLDFINTRLDLYKKLSEPRVNAHLKSRWFEEIYAKRETE